MGPPQGPEPQPIPARAALGRHHEQGGAFGGRGRQADQRVGRVLVVEHIPALDAAELICEPGNVTRLECVTLLSRVGGRSGIVHLHQPQRQIQRR
jgi:hypothetical protein